eukprot:493218-Pleurochrysis_carterae.AAC.2
MEASHGLESAPSPAFGMIFSGETPNKVELEQFLDTLYDTMDQKPYGAMLQAKFRTQHWRWHLEVWRTLRPIADAASIRDRGDASSAACSGGAR